MRISMRSLGLLMSLIALVWIPKPGVLDLIMGIGYSGLAVLEKAVGFTLAFMLRLA
jgi:hypothetical protein